MSVTQPASQVEIEWNGAVAILRMNDPGTLNALTIASLEALDAALDVVEPRARAMILTGAGRAFSSGANLSDEADLDVESEDYDAGAMLETHFNPLMKRLRDLPLPWITAVRGAAAGAGASLALSGDMIVAGDTAFFMQAFARIGLAPDAGSTYLLVRTLGRPRAMELMLLGDRLPAQRALEWGLINQVVPDADLEAAAMALAQKLAQGARSLSLIRDLAWSALDADWPTTLDAERVAQRTAGRTADHREGVAAFRDKRPARFMGH